MRQSENQRSILTNYVLGITAALSGLIVQQRFRVETIAAATLIVLLGAYGAIACAKYHERAHYHLLQARAFTQLLIECGALPDAEVQLGHARNLHMGSYPRLAALRLHHLWTVLHLVILVLGVALLCAIILGTH